jgi:hypothetical protein
MTAENTPLRNGTGVAHRGTEEIAIWLDPPRFWSATQNMSEDEVGRLLNEVMILAEKRDISALRQYDFISLYRRRVPAED